MICPRCYINHNDTNNSEEQIHWENDFIEENGICSCCWQEINENEEVNNE